MGLQTASIFITSYGETQCPVQYKTPNFARLYDANFITLIDDKISRETVTPHVRGVQETRILGNVWTVTPVVQHTGRRMTVQCYQTILFSTYTVNMEMVISCLSRFSSLSSQSKSHFFRLIIPFLLTRFHKTKALKTKIECSLSLL